MPPASGHVLVVDDKEDVLTAIRLLLKEHVAAVHTARDPSALPVLLEEEPVDVVLLDMNFQQDASSGHEGFAWLRRILRTDPSVVVVMMTAYGSVEKAVRAMKAGAADFLVKPWDNERLIEAVRTGIRLRRSRQAAGPPASSRPAAEVTEGFDDIIGRSAPMQAVFRTIEKVAATDANVLLLGENGTGKELVAHALCRHSGRAAGPFVTADLGALSESLFESELFGHAKGAFTGADAARAGRFEKADGGTFFLDEIGNVPPALQKKLLTVLQRREVTRLGETRERPVDLRLVSATNQPIHEMSRQGAFRQDLLYRINTVEIRLPPLRERAGDLSLLAEYFLREYAAKYRQAVEGISRPALERMAAYPWPGNVRELRHTVERAVIMCEEEELRPADLSFSAPQVPPPEEGFPDSLDLEALERAAVRRALSKHGGNVSRAAEELGISRKGLYRRIEKFGL